MAERTIKIAFWGLGSIAKRHIRNVTAALKKRGTECRIDVFRHRRAGIEDEEIRGLVRNVYVEQELKDRQYDMIFITNPTALHLQAISQCASHTEHMFIEKPVCDCSDISLDVLNLKPGGIYYVACPLRYTAVLQYIKKNIDLSRVFSVCAVSSSYLPEWRPGTDYRNTYSAQKALGGGVSIDLIHEWDYLTWLFGFPQRTAYAGGKFSDLEIDSDDLAAYIGVYENKLIELHLDYFGRKTRREFVLFTADEVVTADLAGSRIVYGKSGKVIELKEERDAYQLKEIEHFLDMSEGKLSNDSTVENAVKVLRLARNGGIWE